MANWPKKTSMPSLNDRARKGLFHVEMLKQSFQDFARPNLYTLEFYLSNQFVKSFKYLSETNINKTSMTSKGVDLPAFDIGKSEIKRMGQRFYIPTGQQHGEVQAIILCDDDYTQRKFLHSWLHHIVYDTDGNTYSKVKTMLDNYLVIRQLDNNYNTVFACRMGGVWPSSVGMINYGFDSDSQIVEFPVSFCFSTYEILTTTSD